MAKMKPEKVDDDQLITRINSELSDADSSAYNEISIQRIESNYSYANQQTIRTAPAGKMSRVKMFFTPAVVQTLTMIQSKVFCSNKDTTELVPVVGKQEVIAGADQLAKMINSVLHKENPGFDLITEMFRSAAVNKNSICKVTWGEELDINAQFYEDITEEEAYELAASIEDEDTTVDIIAEKTTKETIERLEVSDLFGEEMVTEEIKRGDYTIRSQRPRGYIEIQVIPPNRFIINEETTSINNDPLTRFVAHREKVYRSDVQEMFPDEDVMSIADNGDDLWDEFEDRARHSIDGTLDNFGEGPQTGPMSKVTLVESWIRADCDGDGYSEWRHCFSIGATLLSNEEWFGPLPFTSFTFFPIPHKFYGLSVYDRIHDLEEIATSLFRSDVDMARLKNTYRLFAKKGTVDKRALQSGRPGVIDVSSQFNPQDVMPIDSPTGDANTIPRIEELRKQVTAVVGIDPITGQVSSDIEKSGNDAAKTQMAMDNANVKMEGMSRAFAEGPLRDISWLIAIELVKHKDSRFVTELVQSITPDQPFLAGEMGLEKIINKSGITAKVGLGHQTGKQKIAAATALQPLLQALEANPSAANYKLLIAAAEGFGFNNPEAEFGSFDFYKKKAQEMQQQKGMAMQKMQLETAQIQQTMKLQQAEFQMKAKIEQAKAQSEMGEDQAKIQKLMAEAEKIRAETQSISQPEAEVKVFV